MYPVVKFYRKAQQMDFFDKMLLVCYLLLSQLLGTNVSWVLTCRKSKPKCVSICLADDIFTSMLSKLSSQVF